MTDPSTESEASNPPGVPLQQPGESSGERENSATDPDAIRRGSPFSRSLSSEVVVVDSFLPESDVLDPEWGVLRSAIWASAWVAIFSIACYQVFPGGGVVVAALGCGLAMIGLFSSRPIPATVLLVTHAGLFFGCYQRLF